MKCKHVYALIYYQTIDNIKNSLHVQKNQDICPICKTNNHVIKRGKRNNQSGPIQLYFCKKCKKRFSGRKGFHRMKYNASIICAALDLYYRGLSLRQIVEHLNISYKKNVSHGTIFNWIKKYVSLLSKNFDEQSVSFSSRWHADETILNVKGRHLRLWAVLDSDTRFLIASHISDNRSVEDASIVMRNAKKKCTYNPLEIVTDGLDSYRNAIKKELQPTTNNPIIHLQGPLSKALNNKIERFNGSIKNRTKTMGSFQNMKTLQNFIDGFTIYYNYIRPNQGIEKKTPAESIGIYKKKANWLDLIINSSNS
jgi:transposase-like protein